MGTSPNTSTIKCLTIMQAMLTLLTLPVMLYPVLAFPAMSCNTTIACFIPPCPSICPPGQLCRAAPCFRPPCPEFCVFPDPWKPFCGCKCVKCGRHSRCVENQLTGAAKCVPKFILNNSNDILAITDPTLDNIGQ